MDFYRSTKKELDTNIYAFILGANLFDASEDKSTPLHVAVREGFHDIAKILIKFGASVNCLSTHEGETPLLIACRKV